MTKSDFRAGYYGYGLCELEKPQHYSGSQDPINRFTYDGWVRKGSIADFDRVVPADLWFLWKFVELSWKQGTAIYH